MLVGAVVGMAVAARNAASGMPGSRPMTGTAGLRAKLQQRQAPA